MSKPKIAIIDYGMGNILSIKNAFKQIGFTAILENSPDKINTYDFLILPGVGAFQQAIQHLEQSGLVDALNDFKNSGKPVLGICLGMQLLCTRSQENGQYRGLDWIAAEVKPFPVQQDLVIPHMGWNEVHFATPAGLVAQIKNTTDFYFVHSFWVACKNTGDIVATTPYGVDFCSIIQHENIMGTQFHPEKSQAAGLQILTNFIQQTC